jgi:site-specific recombinase XerD
VSIYNQFAKYLQSQGIPAFISELPLLKNTYIPYLFSNEEIGAIFSSADNMKGKTYGRTKSQFPMLIRLLYGCGLRLNEGLQLRLSDIDIARGVLKIWNGKGNRDRFVPIASNL